MSSAPASGPFPTILKADVGGYMGSSFTVQLRATSLHYASSAHAREFDHHETISVAAATWTRFAARLDELEVWQWADSYEDEGVLDGTSWEVVIEWGERGIRSSGFNAYPANWEVFCSAMEQLLGGRAFR